MPGSENQGPVVQPGKREIARNGRRPHTAKVVGSNPTRPTINKPGTNGRVANYLIWLQREGYKPQTIQSHGEILRYLARNCNLSDPESVREYLASHRSSCGRKENIVEVYSSFFMHEG